MGAHALGEIKPASTTVGLRATNNQATPAKQYAAKAVQFQALETNSGAVYICDKETPSLTANVLAVIPALSTWSVEDPTSAAGLNAADFWIVPAVTGEGVRVAAVR